VSQKAVYTRLVAITVNS